MADVIRLNHGVLVESYRKERGASFGKMISALVSKFASEWTKAGEMDAVINQARVKAQAYVEGNGRVPIV